MSISEVKLHLGCGKRFIPGYIHVDAQKFPHIDYVCDIRKLPFSDESVDEIYICHALEHFRRNQVQTVLKEFYRVLKKNGVLRLSVPDLEAVFEVYSKTKNLSPLLGLLYGGQRNEFDYHYIGFDFSSLEKELQITGFHSVKRYDALSFLPEEIDDYSKAYLPHMDRNGKLMSLNVITKK